jgi:hypothetical protein
MLQTVLLCVCVHACGWFFLQFFVSGDSLASEFYVPTFQNTVCSISIGGVSRNYNWDDIIGCLYRKRFGSKIA